MKRKCTNPNCSNYHKQLPESKVICPLCGIPTDIYKITEQGEITNSLPSHLNSLNIFYYLSKFPLVILWFLSPILGFFLAIYMIFITPLFLIEFIHKIF
jgi:hypothetical protein